MLRLQKINRINHIHLKLLNEEKNKINVCVNEYKQIIWNNNSKTCKNKYKNIDNLHNIIKSSVLKNYKNVYFYKNLLRIAENRKNDFNLHQINVIIKSLIKAKIYRYSLFHSFEVPILKYVRYLNTYINDMKNNNNLKYVDELYKKLKLNEERYKSNKKCNLYFLIISDQFNILIDIFKSYNYINFKYDYFYETLFFFLTKNYIYLNNRKDLSDIWIIYLNKVLCNDVTFLKNKNEFFNIKNIHNLMEKNSFNFFRLYRHKYKCNINMKTIYNYIITSKKKINKTEKKTSYNSIFCKNNIFSICKYLVIIILKDEKLIRYKNKKINKIKNLYISNGYMYKIRNSNKILTNLQVKYLIKINIVENLAFLKKNCFPKELLNNINFLQKLSNILSEFKIKSFLFNRYIKNVKKLEEVSKINNNFLIEQKL
ncbi:conserved Plasmodium protein, unknown function [Plasmodium gallinaceum]|uniref:Uncharacterized protein n=1 Tax=Plasmodium gallinaceum TaxID=5849 RepID=A0A1J1GX78_PLAGA|nr:conserved Plasmodium protein, unknown function [Plasmodium gallinaceum]CRG95901.1 conserved Plasmodium protein, unknown function [Plasmodium gallinaceum]